MNKVLRSNTSSSGSAMAGSPGGVLGEGLQGKASGLGIAADRGVKIQVVSWSEELHGYDWLRLVRWFGVPSPSPRLGHGISRPRGRSLVWKDGQEPLQEASGIDFQTPNK